MIAIVNLERVSPLMKTLERIYDSIKRLEAPAKNPAQPPREKVPVNLKVKACGRTTPGFDLTGFTTLEPSWVFPPSNNWTFPQTHQPIQSTKLKSPWDGICTLQYSIVIIPLMLKPYLRLFIRMLSSVESKITGFHTRAWLSGAGHHPYAGDFLTRHMLLRQG